MNTVPFSTSVKGRASRALIVLASLIIPAFITWLSSDSFKDFVSAQPWLVAFVPLIVAVLTQVGGELAGRVRQKEASSG